MNAMIRPLIVILTLCLLVLLAGCKTETASLNVNDVASDPGAFSGTLSVTGIVYAFSKADPTLVGIMDKKELQCSAPNCEKVLLPVKVLGKMPTVGDEIVAQGEFRSHSIGPVLLAEELEVVAHHTLGGQ